MSGTKCRKYGLKARKSIWLALRHNISVVSVMHRVVGDNVEGGRKFVLIPSGAGARRVALSTTLFIVKTHSIAAFPDNFIVIYITELSFR